MIEDAGISRGSFYTYFDSKWDVLGYLCESFINEFYECGERCLEAAQGDIWEMLDQSLNGSLALCRDPETRGFHPQHHGVQQSGGADLRYIQL